MPSPFDMATLQNDAPVVALNAAVVEQWYKYITPAASMSGVLALLQVPGIDDAHSGAPVVALTANTKPLLEAPITAYPAVP